MYHFFTVQLWFFLGWFWVLAWTVYQGRLRWKGLKHSSFKSQFFLCFFFLLFMSLPTLYDFYIEDFFVNLGIVNEENIPPIRRYKRLTP